MALPMRVEQRGGGTNPFEIIRQDLNMLNRFFGGGLFGEPSEAGLLGTAGNFGVDIREDADHIYVEADLPGFRKEDINLSLEQGVLSISAERREEVTMPSRPGQQGQQAKEGQKEGDYLLRERRIERFNRSFTLPSNVNEQSVQAKLENGVLKITIDKREEAKPKRIQVS